MPRPPSTLLTLLFSLMIALGARAQLPQITVVDANGTAIADGGTLDFGSEVVGSGRYTKVLTLKNIGQTSTTFPFVMESSTQSSSDFSRSQEFPMGNWDPGETFKCYAIFEPKLGGQRTATLEIRDTVSNGPIFYQIHLTATALQAVIQLERSAGSPWDQSSGSFGEVGVGTTQSLTFTLTNIGTAPMTISQVTVAGNQAADFTVINPPASTLAVSESSTLTVQFSPQALGLRQTSLRIHSNALPYAGYPTLPVPNASFLLSGTCKLSSISLDAAAYEAAATDKQRVVTLTRSPADVAATVRLDTNDGPAQGLPLFTPALAGVDYTDLTGATSLVSFAAGEAQKTVTLLLRAPTSRAGLNRQMTLTLSEPGASAELGSISTATLRIMAADSTKPTVAITTPAAAGKVRVAADEVTVTGKVGDAKGISRVEMSLNGSEPVPVPLGSWTSPTAIPFSFAITPVNGPNELIVTAWDPRGNSTSLKRAFTFLRLRTLAVRVYDSYTQEPSAFMTLTLATTPPGLAQPWQPATTVEPGMIERKAVITPGAQVTLTATAPRGHVFSNWDYVDSLSEFDSRLGNQVTFTMPDADTTLLAIQMLREQSFLPTTTVSLHCLLDSSFPGTPALKGYLTGTLSPTGTFSGKFQVQGKSQPVTAVCYDNGPAVFTVAGKKTDALPVPGGKLRLDPGGATYTSDDDGSYCSGFTQLAPFTTANKVPAAWLNSATQGFYTLRLDPQSELTPSAYPRGYGYATAKLTSTGQISITGALPDGTTITCSSVLLDDGTAPVYQPLLTPGGTTKDGLLFGRLQFTQNGETPHITASLKWFRPAAVSPKVLLYAAGWPAGITLDTNGTLYDSKLAVESMLGLTAPGNGLGNASLRVSGGNLISGITKENFSIVKSAVVKIAPADGSFTLTFTPATGLFSGTFTPDWSNPGSAKPAFKGVILQGTALRGGYGFFLNNAKSEPAPESGVVLLGGPL